MTKKPIVLGSAALALAFAAPQLAAQSWIEDFYSSAGAGVNVTQGGAIASQSVTGYSGAGVSIRIPNRTVQPVQICGPSLRGSCSGVDLWTGAYSFVNKDQFVQALRNMGQAATGYFFNLALRTMAPEIAVTLEAINDIAQKVNQFSIGSCEAASKLIDSNGGEWMKKNAREAGNYARWAGSVVDTVDAWDRQQAGTVFADSYAAKYGAGVNSSNLTAAQYEGAEPVDINVVWWLLKNSKVSATDTELEIAMSYIGPSWIYTRSGDDNNAQSVSRGQGHTITFAQLVGSPTGTESLSLYTCLNVECTNLTSTSYTIPSFSAVANATMQKISAGIVSRTAPTLTTIDDAVIRLSPIPIHRAASLRTASGLMSLVAMSQQERMASYAGMEAAYALVMDTLNTIEKAVSTSSSKIPKVVRDSSDQLIERIRAKRQEANDFVSKVYQSGGNPHEMLEELIKVERAMTSNLNNALASNIRFNQR